MNNTALADLAIEVLRTMVDSPSGLQWCMGHSSPDIHIPPNSIKDVSPEAVANFVKAGLIVGELVGVDTPRPYIKYRITDEGRKVFLESFPNL